MSGITREAMVRESAQEKVKSGLQLRGYTPDKVLVRPAFPTQEERATPLEITTVATGFHFDDGGTFVELGSDLTRRVCTVEFWTFGTGPEFGENVSNTIRAVFEDDYLLPLLDIRDKAKPVIDVLEILQPRGVTVQRQIPNDPRPWDMNVYTTTVKIEDFYSPSEWD